MDIIMQIFSNNRIIEISSVQRFTRDRREILLFIVVACTAFSLAPLLVWSGVNMGLSLALGIVMALGLAIVIVRWPLVGLYVVAGCVLLIEDNPPPVSTFTDTLYVFSWPPSLEGLFERPIGLVFITILFALVYHRFLKRQRLLAGGELLLPFLFYLLCVAGGVAYGLASGGDLKIIVVEVRPFWYMFVSYLIGYNLIRHKRHIQIFFWLVLLSAGFKALQGLYIYLMVLHGNLTGYDSIMTHEESFFFAAFIILFALFCLHYRSRVQWLVALLMLPCVLVALVANQRRADYVALLVGLIVVWLLVLRVKQKGRAQLIAGMLICIIVSAGYISLAFLYPKASFTKPALAVMSIFNPNSTDYRDATSDIYRIIENNDLKYTVKQHPFGLGFGKPFLQPVPLTNIFPQIEAFDMYYNYVPHNTIYWIWMRLGPIGFFALWYLVGSVIVRGSLTARSLRDPYLQLVAIYIVATTFMEIIVAFADYQLFFYRNVIYLGLLLGMLMKLPKLDEKKEMNHI